MNKTTEKELQIFLPDLFANLLTEQKPVAIYKLPDQSFIHLVASDTYNMLEENIDLQDITGFIFHPFQKSGTYVPLLIEDKLHVVFTENQQAHIIIRKDMPYIDLNTVDRMKTAGLDKKVKTETIIDNYSREKYIDQVQSAKESINNGKLQKVVISRYKEKGLPLDFDIVLFFKKLCEQYPSSFVSVVYTEASGIWIGASPEVLLSLDKNLIFRTVSLAGTKIKENEKDNNQATWTQKEIEEQALVSRYIINCFKKIRVREYEEEGPQTITVGQLQHLKTSYSIDSQAINFNNLATVLLELLHPTSAVGGMPKESALDLIQRLEQHDRKYYAGYLGPVNMYMEGESTSEVETHLFVNIRCMEITSAYKALLYAGAGITASSDPEKEFYETESKINTLASLLDNY